MPRAPKSIGQQFAAAKADYAGMTDNRFRRRRPGVSSAGGSADTHYANEASFIRMREYVRAMDRDDFLIGPLTDRAIENQHQGGFSLEVQTGDKKLDADLWQEHDDWCRDPRRCDAAGVHNFFEIERLVGRGEYVDGDVFALPVEGDMLQVLEADRCRTPTNSKRNIVHGVELDPVRRPVRYYFTKESVDPYKRTERVADFNAIDAFDAEGSPQVFHVFKPCRVSQTRGVTRYKAVIDVSTMVEDTNFATLVKQQMAACAVWSWEQDPNSTYGGDVRHGERTDTQWEDFQRAIQEGISPGQMFRPPPGLKLAVHNPQGIPSGEYIPHIKMLITFVSVQLGMPLFLALLDASDTNFSSWRGAWDQTKLAFRNEQRRRAAQFHRQVYLWRVRGRIRTEPAIAKAARRSNVRIFGHDWNYPNWPYLQPLHDAQANAIRNQTGQISLRRLHAEIGSDFETFATENVADNELWIDKAIEATKRLKSKHGDAAKDLHWAHLYHRDFFRGGQLIDTIETPNDGSSTAAIKDGAQAPAKK